MKINQLSIKPYTILLTNHQIRSGALINITDENGQSGWGDIAPLPTWSQETLDDSLESLKKRTNELLSITWKNQTCFEELSRLALMPSVSFGLESALLSILSPLPEHSVRTCALLMGNYSEILWQAKLRKSEGYSLAKLKVSQLSFEEARRVIFYLKNDFCLRVDVNRAWTTVDSLRFFSQFPHDFFEYVEEPFQNPQDLGLFTHPVGVDESFPQNLSLSQLETLPNLKALIYKPTIQGGMLGCFPLHEWASKKGIELVLSSSFESDIGVACVASMAYRLGLKSPVGIGTYHYLKNYFSDSVRLVNDVLNISSNISPNLMI